MTGYKKTLPYVLILPETWLLIKILDDEERIEYIYNTIFENIDIIKKDYKNFKVIEEKDIYFCKNNATLEEKETALLYKCVVFVVPDLESAPEFQRNNIKEIYQKKSDSSIQIIVICTSIYDTLKYNNFCNFIYEKENKKKE